MVGAYDLGHRTRAELESVGEIRGDEHPANDPSNLSPAQRTLQGRLVDTEGLQVGAGEWRIRPRLSPDHHARRDARRGSRTTVRHVSCGERTYVRTLWTVAGRCEWRKSGLNRQKSRLNQRNPRFNVPGTPAGPAPTTRQRPRAT